MPKEIIKRFGVAHQNKKLAEERHEVSEAITEYEMALKYNLPDKDKFKDHVAEEIADNLLLLTEFIQYYDISMDELRWIYKYKLERTKNLKEGK